MSDHPTDRPRRGRGYPPTEYQWKRGQSGNPNGRPRGAKNKAPALAVAAGMTHGDAAAIAEAYRPVTTSDGTTLLTIEAINRARNIQAIKGSRLAAKDADARLRAAEEKAQQRKEDAFAKAVELQDLTERLIRYAAENKLTNQPIYPHPDDIHLDWGTQTFQVRGPMTATEGREWDALFKGMAWVRQQAYKLERELTKDPLDQGASYCLLRFRLQYVDMNEMLPERHRQPRLRPTPESLATSLFPEASGTRT
jgi:hypothetical protein